MSFWQDKKVFVTGGIGFLGSWLVKELVDSGAQVVVLIGDEDPRSNFYKFSLNDSVTMIYGYLQDYLLLNRTINEYEIDIIFHLAAQPIVGVAIKNPLNTFESNIRGTYNLLEACRNNPKVKGVLIASSDKAYGSHDVLPYDESFALKGEYPYDVSKSCTDLLSNCYFKTYGLPVVITRSANFYGGGDYNFSRIVPDTIISVLNNNPPIIRSDGSFVREYIYIKDTVDAYVKLAENIDKVKGQAFNISSGTKYSVLEVVNKILALMNSNLKPIILNEVKSEIKHQYLSGDKIKEFLSWEHKYTFDEGLKETIEWYKEIFKKDKILVTGASGFIGKHLINSLIKLNYEVYALSRNGVNIEGVKSYNVDLVDKEKLNKIIKEIKPNIIFHLAATLDRDSNNRDKIIEINYQGTVNLLSSLDSVNYKLFVNTSTAELYTGNKPPFKEDMSISFNSPYSESKLMAETYCNECYSNGKPIVTVRPFIVYGPLQDGRMFIPQIMEAHVNNKDFNMTKGEQTRDFIYVEDVCDAFIKLIGSKKVIGKIINICSGKEVKMVDVALLSNKLWGGKIKINFGAVPYRDNELWSFSGDFSLAKDLLNWSPTTTLEEGLKKTIDWWKTKQH